MKVAGLLFDFDHTLVHSPIDFEAMRRGVLAVCASFGVTLADPDRKLILELVEEAADRLDPPVALRLRGMAELCIREVERSAASRATPIPGVAGALEKLHADGRRIGIITRNCREVVYTALGRVPLTYDVLLTREDVPRVKPHPDHAVRALLALQVAAAEAMLVGDFRADVACAAAAGIPAVGVLTGASTAEDLTAAGAIAVLPSVAELPEWLDEQGW